MLTISEALEAAWKLHRDGANDRAEALLRQVIQADAGNVEAARLQGAVHQARGELDLAAACFRQVLRARPYHAEFHLELGNVYYHQRRLDEAADCYRSALRLRPEYPQAHTNLGSVLQEQGRLAEAEECHRQALRLDPSFFDALFNLGNALKEQGHDGEAEATYRDALKLRPDFAGVHMNRGMALLRLGRLEEGWPEYEWRFQLRQPALRFADRSLWDGSPPAGRTILLHAEQGMGDFLMFVRYAPLVRHLGARVVLECLPGATRLLAGGPEVDALVSRGAPVPEFDIHAPLLSVPRLVGTRLETIPAEIPYLHADPGLVAEWRERLAPVEGFKVGIAWQGDPTYRWDRQRSIPLAQFVPLASIAGVRLFSLQKGPGVEQLGGMEGWLAIDDLGGRLDEQAGAFMDTAAVMMNLDLVISPDTVIAHLAGALGVPTWLALAADPHWPWLMDRDDTPWYPTMRLFRQRRPGVWGGVFARMTAALEPLAAARTRTAASSVAIEVPLGDLIDRITILEIKAERMTDPLRLANVRAELESLASVRRRVVQPSQEIDRLTAELRALNATLWDVEDQLRACEAAGDFGPRFVELARSVYHNNDHRAALKRAISEALGSRLLEEKVHPSYERRALDRDDEG
jgi:Tfp pilus assembly protein PilF